jgi:hypothetical protein
MKVKIGKYPKVSPKRRISVEIEKFDTWGLDHTLSYIIYPALLQLKATKNGVPAEFAEVGGEDYIDQLSFDFYMETHNESFDEKIKEWDLILDKMIWSFQQILMDEYSEKYHHGDQNIDWIKNDDKFLNPLTGKMEETYTMKHKPSYFFDAEGLKKHEERIQEGLDLFGKYFQHLWD